MSPAKKPTKKPAKATKGGKSGGRALSDAELRKVSGGAEPVGGTIKKPPTRSEPVNN